MHRLLKEPRRDRKNRRQHSRYRCSHPRKVTGSGPRCQGPLPVPPRLAKFPCHGIYRPGHGIALPSQPRERTGRATREQDVDQDRGAVECSRKREPLGGPTRSHIGATAPANRLGRRAASGGRRTPKPAGQPRSRRAPLEHVGARRVTSSAPAKADQTLSCGPGATARAKTPPERDQATPPSRRRRRLIRETLTRRKPPCSLAMFPWRSP